MIVVIEREKNPVKTPGQMLVNAKHFGWVLEDVVRDNNHDGDLDDEGEGKVYGETAIPFGEYKLIISYSNRFKKDMIQVINKPGGQIKFGENLIDQCGVRIHGGNTVENTLGCPLLGANRKTDPASYGDVYNCKDINEKLIKLVKEAISRKEEIILIVK